MNRSHASISSSYFDPVARWKPLGGPPAEAGLPADYPAGGSLLRRAAISLAVCLALIVVGLTAYQARNASPAPTAQPAKTSILPLPAAAGHATQDEPVPSETRRLLDPKPVIEAAGLHHPAPHVEDLHAPARARAGNAPLRATSATRALPETPAPATPGVVGELLRPGAENAIATWGDHPETGQLQEAIASGIELARSLALAEELGQLPATAGNTHGLREFVEAGPTVLAGWFPPAGPVAHVADGGAEEPIVTGSIPAEAPRSIPHEPAKTPEPADASDPGTAPAKPVSPAPAAPEQESVPARSASAAPALPAALLPTLPGPGL